MNKAILVLGTSLISFSSSAANIYDDGSTKADIKGYLAASLYLSGDDTSAYPNESGLKDHYSRVRFAFQHQITDNWVGSAQVEWGFDGQNQDSTTNSLNLVNRLANYGFVNSEVGSIRIGKQWSVYGDIARMTDQFWIWGASASGFYDGRYGFDGGDSGQGRADDALTYRHKIGNIQIGAQYQVEEKHRSNGAADRDYGYQLALASDFDSGIKLGVTYATTKYSDDVDTVAMLFGAKYTSQYWYIATTIGQYENEHVFDGVAASSNKQTGSLGSELYVRYNTTSNTALYGGYNYLEDKDSIGELSYGLLGAEWTPGKLVLAAEYKLAETEKDANGSDIGEDAFGLHLRYFF
ncbi:porin [Photobacterium sp.]|uniref:porin n=1 Tax=Photobacterium sp. TaxID=660 RepID=UPI00299DF6D7|nr:porin [Photobacterium sp.]MDX1302295.1 porin [Photobacterium sp.]